MPDKSQKHNVNLRPCAEALAKAEADYGGGGTGQGLTLVHFSAQPEPCLSQ